LPQCRPENRRGKAEIGDEIKVGTALAVRRWFGWELDQGFDPGQIKIEQESSMEKEKGALAPLGVSREFFPVESQIGVALDGNDSRGDQGLN
jgi:hypothetical protein